MSNVAKRPLPEVVGRVGNGSNSCRVEGVNFTYYLVKKKSRKAFFFVT